MKRHGEDCAHQAQQHLPVLSETAANAKTRAKEVIRRPVGWHGPAAVHAAVAVSTDTAAGWLPAAAAHTVHGTATPRWRLHTSTLGLALAVLAFLATLSSTHLL